MSKSYDGINRLAKNNITKITTDTEFHAINALKIKKGIYGM